MGKIIDLSGQRFGRLTVIEKTEIRSAGRSVVWKCLCDCGNETYVRSLNLRSGHTQSCGCYATEQRKKASTKHGGFNERLYNIWNLMLSRCYCKSVPSYKDYGARGISVCDEWHKYEVFRKWALNNGYSEYLTIERINNNGNYDPNNCKWADMVEQHNNTRRNHFITFNGCTKTMAQWAREFGIKYKVLCWRINEGHWDIARALTEQVNYHA